ncbi:MAG: helix-turn-helix transcriptional regulator [Acidimicrobiia bacterium]|nr:helix-turn-helix transcriptional regulator [Acidimicrobiia bacterium]
MDTDWTPQRGVKTGRLWMHHSQEDLARALQNTTGDRWTRGMIQALESGRKHLTIEIAMAISDIQRLSLDFYAYGPAASVASGSRSVSDRAIPGYHQLPAQGEFSFTGSNTMALPFPQSEQPDEIREEVLLVS